MRIVDAPERVARAVGIANEIPRVGHPGIGRVRVELRAVGGAQSAQQPRRAAVRIGHRGEVVVGGHGIGRTRSPLLVQEIDDVQFQGFAETVVRIDAHHAAQVAFERGQQHFAAAVRIGHSAEPAEAAAGNHQRMRNGVDLFPLRRRAIDAPVDVGLDADV
ncbi:hypothetical protein CATMIT_01995 [Catenibacterium mitsuokai DSM 15897]|nr:hypothetical protein CATMIT_01995 [Catenibacterium mitsuokai DSM 15897]